MNWGLTQGLMGRNRASLTPSALAVGPNTYLSQNDFLKMMVLAFILHAVVLVVASLMPQEKVTTIPVRALSFKLGDVSQPSAPAAPISAQPTRVSAPVMAATSREVLHATPPKPIPKLPTPPRPIIKQVPPPAPVPVAKPTPEPVVEPEAEPEPVPTPMKTPKVIPISDPQPDADALPPTFTNVPSHSAVAPNPQRYVREVGGVAPGTAGAPTAAQAAQTIRSRYEQAISQWVARHQQYPPEAAGRNGRVVVRMRIDRTGYVRYYAIEQSSGVSAIDRAALDMIRRANPMPAVPADYPSGSLIEFLIPIGFRSP